MSDKRRDYGPKGCCGPETGLVKAITALPVLAVLTTLSVPYVAVQAVRRVHKRLTRRRG